jgi:hypothetical protein
MSLSQPALIIHENVVGFPVAILQVLFCERYWAHVLQVDADDQGFKLVSRPRIYVIMYHKVKTTVLRPPQQTYDILKGAISFYGISVDEISACFLASQEEILEEISHLALRMGISPQAAIWDMKALLTEGEAVRLASYISHYMRSFGLHPVLDKDCVFNLADNPDMRCSWSAHSKRLPCYRTNGGKQWSCFLNRWLTSKELLATMGVPVYPALAQKAGVPLVSVQPGAPALKMLGNMFHIASAGSVLLAALASAQAV